MPGRTLMVQGTMSSVGKSLLVAALCRIFKQDGVRVAPFKAQNMALNSFATLDGREVGRAQAMQAAAAGVPVTVEMNPVLIKPEADTQAQIVVLGRPWARLQASEYFDRRGQLWGVVTAALDTLRGQYDLVVLEGAGSPVELNLRRNDLVNMAIAEYAAAPVLLVGDIDRGGIFAQLLGTLALLEPPERVRVAGLLVNKFRGDRRLFDDGIAILEQRGGVPVLGVVPWIPDLRIADEDAVALDDRVPTAARPAPTEIDIAVIRLPYISNFDDYDPLRAEAGVVVRFVDRPAALGRADLIILPGTKMTVADLGFLRTRGLDQAIIARARAGTPVLGICGGYQMLGQAIQDPLEVEAAPATTPIAGLGLLPVVTTFAARKETLQMQGVVLADQGLFAGARGLPVQGYEIHMGATVRAAERVADPPEQARLVQIARRGTEATSDWDGWVTAEGWIAGTYCHGLFDNDALRHILLANLAARKGLARSVGGARWDREAMYDNLAAVVRAHVDLAAIYRILEGG